jgi:hypothetical protein
VYVYVYICRVAGLTILVTLLIRWVLVLILIDLMGSHDDDDDDDVFFFDVAGHRGPIGKGTYIAKVLARKVRRGNNTHTCLIYIQVRGRQIGPRVHETTTLHAV